MATEAMPATEADQQLASVLIEFARTMLTEFPIQAILDRLVERIVDVLPITSAGVTLISPGADPFYVAASDDDALRYEHLQSEIGQGPCVAAYETGEPVVLSDLRLDRRFPRFSRQASAEGLAAVFTFPLHHGEERLGALDLYRSTPGGMGAAVMATAQTLADVAAAYLINAQARLELEISSAGHKRLAAIVESSNDSIISWTPAGIITSWNDGSTRMYGYASAEAIGRDMSLIVPEEQREEIERLHGLAALGGPVPAFETQKVRRDGSTVDVSVAISPIRDATGAIVGLSAVGRDISEKKHAEEVHRSLEAQLQQSQRMESLGQLAGGVAHDFNNLLSVILNYATFVAEAVGDHPEVQDDVEQIVDAAERAARLTRQLLMFGRRDATDPQPLALNAVVEDVRALLANSLGEHIALVVRPGADLPAFEADRGQIEQVLLNLAVNARDAMPDGGTLTIETTSPVVDDPEVLGPAGVAERRFVCLCVSDTGSGMTPDVVARAFEPFFSTKPKGEGTGLGLATVYGIVSEAGGTVDVQSEVAIGTTFRLRFPATTNEVPGPAADVDPRPGHARGTTVLVVEDQEAVRAMTVRLLRRNDYDVLEAATGAQAVAIASVHAIQLLLTDVVMPVMSGPQVASRLRVADPALPVLYMSGYADGMLGPRRALDEGVAVIQKPFVERELLRRVQETIAAGHPASA
jgi:two-component system cell cycle sensor histidine kinase/response regulator CckA